jgi:hypothetical protein
MLFSETFSNTNGRVNNFLKLQLKAKNSFVRIKSRETIYYFSFISYPSPLFQRALRHELWQRRLLVAWATGSLRAAAAL